MPYWSHFIPDKREISTFLFSEEWKEDIKSEYDQKMQKAPSADQRTALWGRGQLQ